MNRKTETQSHTAYRYTHHSSDVGVEARVIGVERCPCCPILISFIGVGGPANCQAADALARLAPLWAEIHSMERTRRQRGSHGEMSATTDDARP